jgi:hypothetical protein
MRFKCPDLKGISIKEDPLEDLARRNNSLRLSARGSFSLFY